MCSMGELGFRKERCRFHTRNILNDRLTQTGTKHVTIWRIAAIFSYKHFWSLHPCSSAAVTQPPLINATLQALGIKMDKVKALLLKPDDDQPELTQVVFEANMKLSALSSNASGKEFDSRLYWGFDDLDKALAGSRGTLRMCTRRHATWPRQVHQETRLKIQWPTTSSITAGSVENIMSQPGMFLGRL